MQVSVTEFRKHMFEYLENISTDSLDLTLKGEVVARLFPPEDLQKKALARLKALRKTAVINELDWDLSKEVDWSADQNDRIGY